MQKIIGFCSFLLLAACAGEGSTGTEKAQSSVEATSDVQPLQALGKIRFYLADEQWVDGTEAFVIGQDNKARHISGSEYVIDGLDSASYDLLVTNKKLALANRVNKIQVLDSKDAVIQSLELYPTLNLKGKVLADEESAVGAKVYIPGTPWNTTVTDDGFFSLEGISRGPHQLLIEKDGFYTGRIEALNIAKDYAEQDFDLEIIRLWPERIKGPALVNSTSIELPSEELRVSLGLLAPKTANQMRVGSNRFLENLSWQPLQTSWQQSFPADGSYKVFVQFANNGQQLSQVYETTIYIESLQP